MTSHVVPRVVPVLLAFGAFACTPATPPESPGPVLLQDDSYRLLIDGQQAGNSRRTTSRQPDGTVLTTQTMQMTVRRVNTTIDTGATIEMWEDSSGALKRFRMVTRLSQKEMVITGEIRGDTIELTADGIRSPPKPHDPAARGPYWLESRMREALRKPGDTFRAVAFFPEISRCGTVEAVAEQEEALEIDGTRRTLLRATLHRDVLPGFDTRVWVDQDGVTWKIAGRAMGLEFEEIRASSGLAATRTIDSPPEIFIRTAVRPDRPLANASRLDSVVYRFTLLEKNFAALGLDSTFHGAGQTVLREESPSVRVVRIDTVESRPGTPLTRQVAGTLAAFLRPNALIQSDDARIASAAHAAIGGATDALVAARKLEIWVHDTIRTKDLGTAFASARETLDTRRGDCTEHGVLLAALARASGIPARIATGLVYHDGAFVGHMWTEVFIDRWVPLDATRGRGRVGPDHIALAVSDLDETTSSKVFFDLASILGNLKIEILEP